jgi:hypothetical protein
VKIFLTILSFIVLLLSTVPCNAFAKDSECVVEKDCENDSLDCGMDCNGKCSPFYSCGSCVGFTINFNSIFFTEKLEFIPDEVSKTLSYNQFVDSSFLCKIWQPPKVY